MSFRDVWKRLWLSPGAAPKLSPELAARIRRSFDESAADEEHFPSTIDPRIEHVRILSRFFGPLQNKKVLDAGCGKGRFARALLDEHPGAKICGLDISEEMLRYVPDTIAACTGSLTNLPFPDAAFDFVYATESLEHAVEIEKAVAELCRVVRPGGKLLIIDKNAEHWGKLKTPEWERWFDRKEIERYLRAHCRTVTSQFISYWEDVPPDGMFIVWMAEK